MPQYFDKNDNLKDVPKVISYEIGGKKFSLSTNTGVFSKNGIDEGTYAFLKVLIPSHLSGKILDLGCGYGALGLTLAALNENVLFTLADVNERALELCKVNCCKLGLKNVTILQSDVYSKIEGNFDSIVINPPIRAGKKIIYQMFEGAFNHLNYNGSLYIVIRKSHGAESACKFITSVFGNCNLLKRDKGYYMYQAIKTDKEN